MRQFSIQFQIPNSLKKSANLTQEFDPQIWSKSLTHDFDPQNWPTSFSHQNDPRVWPTNLTHKTDPPELSASLTHEFDTQEFPTNFIHTFDPWKLPMRAMQPTQFSIFSISYINNLFFLNYFRQFVECYIKSAIWNILHSSRPIRRKKLIRAGNKYHY